MGGMSAAALLAKAGKMVLVLEQHDVVGGCCHTFFDKGILSINFLVCHTYIFAMTKAWNLTPASTTLAKWEVRYRPYSPYRSMVNNMDLSVASTLYYCIQFIAR